MNKKILGLFLAVALLATGVAPHPAHASAVTPGRITITGTVTHLGQPIAGIQVMVECWDTGFVSRPITNAHGVYFSEASQSECPLGSTLKVRSNTNLNALVGFKFGTVQLVNHLDIALVDTHGVPEFGWLGGALAGGVGVGAIMFARRRYAFARQRA